MAALLNRLSREPAGPERPADRLLTLSVRMDHAMSIPISDATDATTDPAGVLSCPECGGPIETSTTGTMTRFRCIIGHAFTGETILSAQAQAVERALCEAMRVHEERIRLYESLSEEARKNGQSRIAARYEESMREYQQHAGVLRRLLETTPE